MNSSKNILKISSSKLAINIESNMKMKRNTSRWDWKGRIIIKPPKITKRKICPKSSFTTRT